MANISKIKIDNTVYDIVDNSKYTNAQIDSILAAKADSSAVYTQDQIDTLLTGKKDVQNPVSSPAASGSSDQFIFSITQDANGIITPTKRTVRNASASQTGLMTAAQYIKLDNLPANAYNKSETDDLLALKADAASVADISLFSDWKAATLASGITGYARYIKVGDIVVFTAVLVNAAAINNLTNIFSGFPVGEHTGPGNSIFVMFNNNTSQLQTGHLIIRNSGIGTYVGNTALPVGNWRVSGAYLN